MTDARMEIPVWSRKRWYLAIALVLVFQAVLILLLEKHSRGEQRPSIATPIIRLQTETSLGRFLISDPTVFVLPHRDGFSGEAWLNHLPVLKFQPAEWTEPPRSLALTVTGLGASFEQWLTANQSPQFDTIGTFSPAPGTPSHNPIEVAPVESTLRIEGPLALRRMLTTPRLRAFESSELLTNSIVQVLVDAEGNTISAVLLAPGVRLEQQGEADTNALALAKAAQFEPATPGTVTLGQMIFEWQTLPPSSTNALPVFQ